MGPALALLLRAQMISSVLCKPMFEEIKMNE